MITTPSYEPWARLNQLRGELDRLFEPMAGVSRGATDNSHVVTGDWVPAVDIKEDADRFVLFADVPGTDAKQIEITMEKGVLTIKGERSGASKETRQQYKRTERPWGTFYRRFNLPDTADPDKITARTANGVLELVIPKRSIGQARKIQVES
ncbi:MAG: Hsp20/alpha crystallin family protein [Candidatus Competibacteraceae bacterium]|nr:Hsp20/alpha crystallin family protein [Candidatus Competibacteraceae bacterium]